MITLVSPFGSYRSMLQRIWKVAPSGSAYVVPLLAGHIGGIFELLVEGVVAVIEVPKSEELVLELMEVENMVLGVGVITEPHGPEELEDPLLDPKMLVGLVVVLAARMKLGRLDGIVKVVLDEMALPEDIMLLKELSTVLMVGIVYCEDVLFEEVSIREVLVAVLVPELRVN